MRAQARAEEQQFPGGALDMPSKASKPETGRATGGKRVELHAPHWTPRICTQQTAEGLRTGGQTASCTAARQGEGGTAGKERARMALEGQE